MSHKKVAVILSGCGVFDGSEIHEAVSTLLALDLADATYECFAPNILQTQVVNHLTNAHENEKRNTLVEAARIARGKIRDIKDAEVKDFDAAIYPGGHGAALNLCDFGKNGANMSINADVLRFAQAMKNAKKPQGFICIAPAMISKIYGAGVAQTIGNDLTTKEKIEKMGGKHVDCAVNKAVIDHQAKVVSTPAYMLANRISEVFSGVSQLVKDVLAMA
ncbi:MAG TPA: isoprenoid biosynthesis glyoxalase ElbB [Coxiellaceae bacterium]|nr:MAG: isoprenoid biosynthesis protein ElbB [Gammaproteobacteria bacterium RIFCSPHIGHO2_12_FULL_36_30]HLB55945.1 isoprenoid biosynthesis glyoxalase ElbB [Coxiellaceae bacterium]